MEYKLLKYIETVDSIPLGTIFELSDKMLLTDDGSSISVEFLKREGFIQEVKEEGINKPEWKIGDKVSYLNEYFIINSIIIDGSSIYYNGFKGRNIRKPTEEELKTYYT